MMKLVYLAAYCTLCLAIVPCAVALFRPREALLALRQHSSVVGALVGLPLAVTALVMI
jgi:hypothetical protein